MSCTIQQEIPSALSWHVSRRIDIYQLCYRGKAVKGDKWGRINTSLVDRNWGGKIHWRQFFFWFMVFSLLNKNRRLKVAKTRPRTLAFWPSLWCHDHVWFVWLPCTLRHLPSFFCSSLLMFWKVAMNFSRFFFFFFFFLGTFSFFFRFIFINYTHTHTHTHTQQREREREREVMSAFVIKSKIRLLLWFHKFRFIPGLPVYVKDVLIFAIYFG